MQHYQDKVDAIIKTAEALMQSTRMEPTPQVIAHAVTKSAKFLFEHEWRYARDNDRDEYTKAMNQALLEIATKHI